MQIRKRKDEARGPDEWADEWQKFFKKKKKNVTPRPPHQVADVTATPTHVKSPRWDSALKLVNGSHFGRISVVYLQMAQ